MPKTIHGHPVDEAKWAEAKAKAAESGEAENYAVIMTIYKRLVGMEKSFTMAGKVRQPVTAYVNGKPYQTYRWKRPARGQNNHSAEPKKVNSTETPEFKAWFGDSKVVDEEGNPLVVYHGSGSTNIQVFLPKGNGDGDKKAQNALKVFREAKLQNQPFGYMNFRSGTFFSPDPEYAGHYTGENAGVMYPVYIKAENPIYFDQITGRVSIEHSNKTADALFMMDGDKINEIAVIDPIQVKSAIGNSGAFDPADPDIRKALDRASLVRTPVTAYLNGRPYQTIKWKRRPENGRELGESDKENVDNKKPTIYRDQLGNPEPMASISTYTSMEGYWPNPTVYKKRLVLVSASDVPRKEWDYSANVDHIISEMDHDGWDCRVEIDGRGDPNINCEHRATRAYARSLKEKHDKKWANAKDVYVRFGDIPKGGFSTDWSSGKREKGVSVFRGKILENGDIMPLPYTNQELGSLLTMNERPLYVIEGEEAGVGADGEPVLVNAKKFKPKDAAKRLYGDKPLNNAPHDVDWQAEAERRAKRKKKNKTSLTKAMEGFHADIERATKKNKNYRRVLYTGPHAQLVLMSLKSGEEIGEEVHEHLDQFIRIDAGEGLAIIGKRKYPLKDGDAIVIPAGAKHNIIARSTLKLYAVYTSTEHPDGLVEMTKQDEGMKKSIRLVVPMLLKARKSPKLVPIKRTVYRDGTSYTATYWVLPSQAKQGDMSGAQADLFDHIPSGAQMDLFDQAPQAEIIGPDEDKTVETSSVEEAPKPKDDKIYKDVGEKIGGAKKDLWVQIKDGKRSLSLVDMDGIDDGTARTIVKKAHIIPADYIEGLKDAGVDPAAAFMISKVLSFISPEPATDTRQARINYVAAIERIMKGMRDVKTLDDFRQSFTQLQRESRGILLNAYEKAEYDEYQEASMRFREARKDAWKRLYNEELGKLKEITISGSDRANLKASSRLYDWDRENRKKYIDDSLKTAGEIERASAKRQEQDPESLLNIIGSLGERMVDMLKGRSKAFNDQYGMVGYNVKDWSWMEKKGGGGKKTEGGRKKPVWERDTDEKVERSGGEQKTYTPEMLMDEFGFRGVEYGNWMDEASSAHHTQMLGLSFQDMANVLGIPVEQVSFNRRLAIAFGARGGGNALAHYEPNRKVINLTKFKGGGSLAHEWFHFLDNVTRMAATGGSVQFSFMTDIEKDTEAHTGVDPQVIFAWSELKKSLLEGNTRSKKSDPEKNVYRRFNFVDNLLARMGPQEVIDYIYQNHPYNATDKWMEKCANYIHFKTGTEVTYGKGQSGVLATAKAMGTYWQKPIEMAARAFEAYVHDKMKEAGMRNTYLTKDQCSNEYCTAWAKAYKVPSSPYPIGDERKAINAAFDRLMEALRKDNTLQKAMRIVVWMERRQTWIE